MDMTISHARPFCVYMHYVENQLIYIGSGTIERAFRLNGGRNDRWHELIAGHDIRVQIYDTFADRASAYKIEMQLIAMFAPPANLQVRSSNVPYEIGCDIREPKPIANYGRGQPIRCVETGIVFQSSVEAARIMQLSQSAISNVANGRHASVGGYTFHKIPWHIFQQVKNNGKSSAFD